MCKFGFDKGTWCSPLFGRPHPTASPAGEGMAARGGRARGAARACPLLFAEEVAPLTGPTGGNSPLRVSWEDGRQGRPKPAGQPLAHAAAGARGHLARGGKRPPGSLHSRFPERVPAFARQRMPPHPPTHAAASANACRCIRQRMPLHPGCSHFPCGLSGCLRVCRLLASRPGLWLSDVFPAHVARGQFALAPYGIKQPPAASRLALE